MIEQDAEVTIGELVRLLRDPEPRVRERAAICLSISTTTQEILSDTNGTTRTNLLITPEMASNRIVPALINLLMDTNAVVRDSAVQSLGAFGDDARAAAPELKKLLRDSDLRVRSSAERTLEKIESPRTPQF
jgi:HEAT repeat protein